MVYEYNKSTGQYEKKVQGYTPSSGSSSGSGSHNTVVWTGPSTKPTMHASENYIPKVGDVINAAGELVRTEAIKRPGGGYYSYESPETVALKTSVGMTPTNPSLASIASKSSPSVLGWQGGPEDQPGGKRILRDRTKQTGAEADTRGKSGFGGIAVIVGVIMVFIVAISMLFGGKK